MTKTDIPDLAAGTAAEHLVCADILLRGYTAFLTDQICPYDIVAGLERGNLIRIQVKATREPRSIPQRLSHIPSCMWYVRRAGKGGARVYDDDEFDVLALVALDIKQIAYVLPEHSAQSIHIRPPGSLNGKQFADYTFDKIEEEFCI